MVTGSVARRWAKALFLIGQESGKLALLEREVARAAETWNVSEELQEALQNPMMGVDVRRAIFSEVLGKLALSNVASNFMRLLFDKNRISELPGVAREFAGLCDEAAGRVRADVVSAAPLPDAVVGQIKSAIESATRKTVVVSKQTDPFLIGGVLTRVGGLMVDGTIRSQLDRLKAEMRRA